MNRFFIPQTPLVPGSTVAITDAQDVHHVRRVLRLRSGDRVEIADGAEKEAVGAIVDISDGSVTVRIESVVDINRESPVEITLFQSLPKGTKLETVFQKNTEIGVTAFVPLLAERCVSRIEDAKTEKKKLERWQAIIDEAAKQAKRSRVPRIAPVMGMREALKSLDAYDLVLVPHTGEGVVHLRQALGSGYQRIAVFIGPEGGFTETEAAALADAGAIPVTLGPRILRTETAGFVVSSILQYVLGDMGGAVR